MKNRTKKSIKKVVKKDSKAIANAAIEDTVDYVSELDYKKITKNALKIAIPLVVLKMIHSKYSDSKKHPWKKAVDPLLKEIKSKLKNM